jgi:hypothetical protein
LPRSYTNNSFAVRPTFTLEKTARRNAASQDSCPTGRSGEYWSLFLGAGALFVSLSLFSYNPKDPSFNVATPRPEIANWCGLLGSHLSDALVQLLGTASLMVPAALWVLATCLYRGRIPSFSPANLAGGCAVLAALSVLAERFGFGLDRMFPVEHAGGALGSFLHGAMLKYLGGAGEMLLTPTALVAGLLSLARVSLRNAGEPCVEAARFLWSRCAALPAGIQRAVHRKRIVAVDKVEEVPLQNAAPSPPELPALAERSADPDEFFCRDGADMDQGYPDDVWGGYWRRLSVLPECPEAVEVPISSGRESVDEEAYKSLNEAFEPEIEIPASHFTEDCEEAIPEAEIIVEVKAPPVVVAPEIWNGAFQFSDDDLSGAIEDYLRDAPPYPPRPDEHPAPAPLVPVFRAPAAPIREIAVTERADVEISTAAEMFTQGESDDYVLPPAELLDEVSHANRDVDASVLTSNAGILERKLSDLGVQAAVVAVHPGPVITMYELSLAPGVPLRRVMNMADDLAMALKSGSTRVVAPIPGKDTVGVEVPNLNREVVQFREIIESQPFREAPGELKMALGKRIDGRPFATSLLKMPHLLIAGATGTGKSVGLNSLICSWLMSCRPDDVKFLLVDPKKLELSYYQDIPHLLHPVVTDPDKVPAVLGWAIREMERRYDLLSLVGARNIVGYNQMLAQGRVPPGPDGRPEEKLPYIVIIVDELAELMMVAAKDIEISIARLAQMARASGIHLILATQRPSVDVITGVIKANFPARLSYQVSAKADSRTILDTVGAEHLLGMGDMLFLPPGTGKMVRLHGAFISENEIRRIVDFVKAQRRPQYLQEISRTMAGDGKQAGPDLGYDEKYDEAVDLVTRLGHASISLIQRHMRIGYNRAARIMETMESEGLVAASDGTSRPREVLVRSLHSIADQPN